MKIRYPFGLLLAVALIGGLVAWAADDNAGRVSAVRTQKGLSVAAITQGRTTGEESDTTPAGTGAPAPLPPGFSSAGLDAGIATDPERYGGAPLLQQGVNGITVQGFGSATADADAAIIEFYFSTTGAIDTGSARIEPGYSGSAGGAEPAAPDQQEVAQISAADLQPVIDALVAAGVSRDDIEFIGQSYFDKYYSSATLRAKVNNVDSVDAAVQAATSAAAGLSGIILNATNVSYTVNDCTALEEAAMRAAVEDAGERAAVFGRALGVGVGSVIAASNYSYFGGTPCDPGFYPVPYPLGGVSYAEGQPRQVQVIANIAVTYAIQ